MERRRVQGREIWQMVLHPPRDLPRVACMATMPSRATTAPKAIASLLPQVDRLWLFLDRFEKVPEYALHAKIKILRSQELGDFRCSGRFFALKNEQEPVMYMVTDDDLLYPTDYADNLSRNLKKYNYEVVVGLHAAILRRKIRTYRTGRRVYGFARHLMWDTPADILGMGCTAFSTGRYTFDVRNWPVINMDDLTFAMDARVAGLPLISIRRRSKWLRSLEYKQPDSLYVAMIKDESKQTEFARLIRDMPRPASPPLGLRLRFA